LWIRKKCLCGEKPFLQGVLAFLWYFVMVIRGEVVVNYVVNRSAWTTLFGARKFSSFLKNILLSVRGWERREQQIPPPSTLLRVRNDN
jgi:hypothetical protein